MLFKKIPQYPSLPAYAQAAISCVVLIFRATTVARNKTTTRGNPNGDYEGKKWVRELGIPDRIIIIVLKNKCKLLEQI